MSRVIAGQSQEATAQSRRYEAEAGGKSGHRPETWQVARAPARTHDMGDAPGNARGLATQALPRGRVAREGVERSGRPERGAAKLRIVPQRMDRRRSEHGGSRAGKTCETPTQSTQR